MAVSSGSSKGLSSDILQDGSLDYSEDVLDRFEFVVASVHSRFRLDKKAQTERILRAVANPHTTVLGHMTGRMLLRRSGYEIDVERVLRACAQYGVAVEINANPHRLDVDWRWHQRALELGCRNEHQSGRALDRRAGPDALGCFDGTQGRCLGRTSAELSHPSED